MVYKLLAYLNLMPGERHWQATYTPKEPPTLVDVVAFLKTVMVENKGVDFRFSGDWIDVTGEEE